MTSPLRRIGRTLLGLAVLATAAAVTAAPGIASAATCSVAYTVTTTWGLGFQGQLTLTPGAAVTAWNVQFDVADQQVVTFTYGAVLAQSGRHVTLTNAVFNGNVPAGSSVNVLVGVHTNPTATNVPPASFTVNGQACAYAPPPYLVPSAYMPTVPEGGSTPVAVQLSRAPTGTITVTVGSGSTFPATPASLTFTPTNWNVPQTVTVRSPEDADTTGQTGYVQIQQQNYLPPMYIAAWLIPMQLDND
jgi:cellulose 1,4-beta-cellobiosidase